MTPDRSEATGFGVAIVGHAALVAALYYLIDPRPDAGRAPAPPSIEVSFVEETGIIAAGETAEAAAKSVAPEAGPPEEAAPAEPAPAPVPEPVARPTPAPSPAAPSPAARRAAPTPAPAQQRSVPQPRRQDRQAGAGRGQANRGAALGADLLKGIGNDPASTSRRAPGAVMTSQARADIGSLIARQVQPCANRQRSPGPGAERIRVTIRLRINGNGSLAGQPTIVAREGVDEANRRYLALVEENTINSFTQCSPLRGLPAELYDVPGGWRDFRLRYRLPG
ncbi:MAG TPA: cell envelope biogenesis protein TolA [Allosphingosinicella sp.]|nr:cell envelope biogenesis protein TolA [Allosphingosinicella sp.]